MPAIVEFDFSQIEPSLFWEQLGVLPQQARARPLSGSLHRVTIEGVTQAEAETALLTYAPPAPTSEDVRAEASRRMQALVGARDADHLAIIIANASREAIRLLRIGEANWTAEQAARAHELEAVDAMIEHIRARSNAMEESPPADYAADAHWT